MSISDTQKLTTLHPEVNGQPDNNTNIYPNVPRYLTLCYNLVVNGNGAQFSHNGSSSYKFVEVPSELSPYPQYTISLFAFGGGSSIYNTQPVTDLSIIKEYLMFMNGSDYVPVYNATQPNECFLWKNQDDTCWKLQYTENVPNVGSVLLAFKVDENKLPLMQTIKKMRGLESEVTDGLELVDGETTVEIRCQSSMEFYMDNPQDNQFGFVININIKWYDDNGQYTGVQGSSIINYAFEGRCTSGSVNLYQFDKSGNQYPEVVARFDSLIFDTDRDNKVIIHPYVIINKDNLYPFDPSTPMYGTITVTKLYSLNIGG